MILIKTKPEKIYIEMGEYAQYLNFDFILENDGEEDVTITKIIASFLNEKGELILRKFLNQNGMVPNLEIVRKTRLEKNQKAILFNPFHTHNPLLDVKTIQYEFTFITDQGVEKKLEVTVHPNRYVTKTDLILPLKGKLVIYDGHDYLAHHRRVDLTHPLFEMLGIQGNFVRGAVDFVPINEQADVIVGDGKSEKDWLGWGAVVYAPGAGTVVLVQNDIPDNLMGQQYEFVPGPDVMKLANGNCVVIDHGNGEISWLVHLQKGSVLVKEGDTIKQGQELARVGFSGDAGAYVHLHYTFTDQYNFTTAEGLPPNFRNFYKKYGNEAKLLEKGALETGEIVWSNFEY
jgi:hypothetical protein